MKKIAGKIYDIPYYERKVKSLERWANNLRKLYIEAIQDRNRKTDEIQRLRQERESLIREISLQKGTIEGLRFVNELQRERIHGSMQNRYDEDYDANDLKNILKNNRPASGGEMSEEEINRLIEEKRHRPEAS